MKQVITVKLFCQSSSLTPEQAQELIRNGSLDAVRFGGRYLIYLDGVGAFIKHRKTGRETEEDHAGALVSAAPKKAA